MQALLRGQGLFEVVIKINQGFFIKATFQGYFRPKKLKQKTHASWGYTNRSIEGHFGNPTETIQRNKKKKPERTTFFFGFRVLSYSKELAKDHLE